MVWRTSVFGTKFSLHHHDVQRIIGHSITRRRLLAQGVETIREEAVLFYDSFVKVQQGV